VWAGTTGFYATLPNIGKICICIRQEMRGRSKFDDTALEPRRP
jgi:hypothetical protein